MTSKNEPEQPQQKVRDADDVIRSYYEGTTEGAFRGDLTEPISSAREPQSNDTELSGGDIDAEDQSAVGTETVGGSNPTPDQDIVDDLGRAAGVTYQDNEPLKFGDKVTERDDQRWELDPASAEDYQARVTEEARSSSAPSEQTGQESKDTTRNNPQSKGAAGGRKPPGAVPPVNRR
jgi:hypothetical protein